MPQEQGHDHAVEDDRGLPGATGLQPTLQGRAQQHRGADRPDPAEQEAHRRRVGVRDTLDVGAEQTLRVVPDAGEPIEPRVAEQLPERRSRQQREQAEPANDHRPEHALRQTGERPVGVEEPELVREQQHERHVAPPQDVDPDDESEHVGCDGARDHHRRHPPPEATVQPDQPRRERDHDQVDAEEPQRPEREGGAGRQEEPQQGRVAPHPRSGRRADIQQVHRELDDRPDREEDERGAEQPRHAAPDEGTRRTAASARRVVGNEVREPADEEEDRHHLQEPGGEPEVGRHPDRAGGAQDPAVPPDHRDRPMAEDHCADARGPQEVDDPVAIDRRRIHHRVQ